MPAVICRYITDPALFIAIWIVGGFLSLVGASIYAEMGTRFTAAGGPFVYARKAFGNTFGFTVGWANWIFSAGVIAYLAIALSEYTNKLLKTNLPIGLMSALLIILLTVMQWQGLRLSGNFQKIMSALKAIGLLVFVVACFSYFFNDNTYSDQAPLNRSSSIPLISAIILSLRAIFVTYGGWNTAVYFTEEDTKPEKNLPRSLIWGVVSIMIIYVLVNVGLIAVLRPQEIARSVLPAADAAQLIFGGRGDMIVTTISVISLFGILNAVLLFSPRILFAASRTGLFFKSASKLNKHSIPGNALIITSVVSVFFASTGIFNLVVNITALLIILVDLSVYLSIIFIRRQNPSIIPPYRAPGYPYNALMMIMITLGLVVGLFFEDTEHCIYSLIILSLAFPFYFLFKKLSGNHVK
jgi:APA family basic amino acid/polyamine antiporter